MNYLHRVLGVASAAFFIAGTAWAQQSGTVTTNAFAVGQGAGTTGFSSVLCANAQLAIGQNAAKPICAALSGDMTMDAGGAVTIGTSGIPVSPSDATSALQSVLNTRKNIRLPCGLFLITAKITFAIAGQTLSGCSREGTVIRFSSGSANYMIETTLADTSISNLTLDMNFIAGITQGCAIAIGAPRTKWTRVGCINTPDSSTSTAGGFALISTSNSSATGSYNSEIRDCYVANMNTTNPSYNAHAVLFSFSDYSSVIGCTSSSIDNGVNTQSSNYVVIANNMWSGNSRATTGFAGVRCSNGTFGATISGNVITNMPRGIFPLGCTGTAITGNSITNCQYQCILISATTGNASPTYYVTVTGNSIRDTCLSNTCNYAIEINTSGGGLLQGNMISSNTYYRVSTPPSTAMIGISGGVSGGQNTCVNNQSNIAIGSC